MARNLFFKVLPVLLLGVWIQGVVFATDIHVPTEYATIQAAVDAASHGDQVLVAAGIYNEHVVMRMYVDLLGGYESTNWTRDVKNNPTIIDGGGSGYVVSMEEDGYAVFDGFIVRNGEYGFVKFTFPSATQLVISNNEFIGNGIRISFILDVVIKNNIIRDVPSYFAMEFRQPRDLWIINNLIYDNIDGCYTYHEVGTIWYVNNTIINSGTAIRMQVDQPHFIVNNIIAGNEVGLENTYQAVYSISNNLLWGNTTDYLNVTPGENNLSEDPKFRDTAAGNYRPLPDSAAVDAGSNSAPDLPATDLDGYGRVFDGDGDGTAVVDMGAYESTKFYPQADAGPDRSVDMGVIVTLDGSQSSDTDDGIDSYYWSQVGGEDVLLSDASTANPTFTAPVVQPEGDTLLFNLTVTDAGGLQSTDSVAVTVNYLDTTAPVGVISVNSGAAYTNSRQVAVALNCNHVEQMAFSNNGVTFSEWEAYGGSKTWTLDIGDGLQTVYAMLRNSNGKTTIVSDTIELDTVAPERPRVTSIGRTEEDEPTLEWKSVSGAHRYIIEYARQIDFSNAVQVDGLEASQYTVPTPLENGQWYWRVRAVDLAGNESPWRWDAFRVETSHDCSGSPEPPVLLIPKNGATLVACNPVFETDPFNASAACSRHTKTRWQIHTSNEFSGDKLININTGNGNSESGGGNGRVYAGSLTRLELNENTLRPNTTYYWRVRFWAEDGQKSPWSRVRSFTTAPYGDDGNNDGIPDLQQVDDSDDLDGDGTPDNAQTDVIKSIKTQKGALKMGVRAANSNITRIEAMDDADLPERSNKLDVIPNGLLSLRIETPEYGRTVQLRIHLSPPVPESAYWIMYDKLNGWYDYSDYAALDSTRSILTLELQDGGHGDGDYTENGVIIDPGGIAIRTKVHAIGTGCFIDGVTR